MTRRALGRAGPLLRRRAARPRRQAARRARVRRPDVDQGAQAGEPSRAGRRQAHQGRDGEARGSAGQLRVHEERRDPRLDARRGSVLLEHRRDPRRREQFRLAESKDQRARVRVAAPGGRRITVVCVVPRMRFSEALREELSQEIRKFLAGARSCASTARRPTTSRRSGCTSPSASTGPNVTDADLETLSEELEHLLESWDDQLRAPRVQALPRRDRGEPTRTSALPRDHRERAGDLERATASRFPESYKGTLPPESRCSTSS